MRGAKTLVRLRQSAFALWRISSSSPGRKPWDFARPRRGSVPPAPRTQGLRPGLEEQSGSRCRGSLDSSTRCWHDFACAWIRRFCNLADCHQSASATLALALKVCAICVLLWCGTAAAQEPPAEYLQPGERALADVRRLTAIGPRPAGSKGQQRQQELLLAELKQLGAKVAEVDFTAQTPKGPRAMKNIVVKLPGTTKRVTVVSGHYDTLDKPSFVGANDGGSSAALLLALAQRLAARPRRDAVWLVFLDGEEAVVSWRNNDHTYGSREQAKRWKAAGLASRIQAVINVDMIGDKGLRLTYEGYSTPWLRSLVWETAGRLGYEREFPVSPTPHYIEDDHVPFIKSGFAAVNLIDFDYGLFNRYWHTPQDTADKLSARSFAVMLHVLEATLEELEKRP